MKEFVFVTNNQHKLQEVSAMAGNRFIIHSLSSIGCFDDIAETGLTLEENAELKVRYVYDRYGIPCFADDTGLEVEALHGSPGVFSARYAGEDGNSERNIDKLLQEMKFQGNRKACFRTVFALIEDQKTLFFEGKVYGKISLERFGSGGFGYDSVFVPEGYEKTFAELDVEVKNKISHRSLAMHNMMRHLQLKQ